MNHARRRLAAVLALAPFALARAARAPPPPAVQRARATAAGRDERQDRGHLLLLVRLHPLLQPRAAGREVGPEAARRRTVAPGAGGGQPALGARCGHLLLVRGARRSR